jgi:heme A synthase
LHGAGNLIRLSASAGGVLLIIALLWQAWRRRRQQPGTFRIAGWVLVFFSIEILVQVLLLALGYKVSLLVTYTVSAAAFWGLLMALVAAAGMEADLHPISSTQNGGPVQQEEKIFRYIVG